MLAGCIFDKKNIVEDNFIFTVVSKVENISQDDAKILGFIFLPFSLQESVGKKNDNFYIVDCFYLANMESFASSYELLKNLYIQDGWTLIEEAFSNLYIHACFKKQDKEMAIFVQEKEIKTEQKEKRKQILLHQSLLLC